MKMVKWYKTGEAIPEQGKYIRSKVINSRGKCIDVGCGQMAAEYETISEEFHLYEVPYEYSKKE